MPEPWQQWMPHYINRWQSSADIQALSDQGYRAVHNLMLAIWESEECSLSSDDKELAKKSRAFGRWSECKEEVLEYFDNAPGGKITHPFLLSEWIKARRKYEANHELRSRAGKKGNEIRWSSQTDRSSDDGAIAKHRKRIAKASPEIATETLTGTGTNTKKEQKPSAVAGDVRHVPFRETCEKYAIHKHVTFTWDGSEAKALDSLLKAAPLLTHEEFHKCVNHRSKSPGTPHGERPRIWLPNILKYQQGPLNEFNRTEEASGANRKHQSKGGQRIDSQREALIAARIAAGLAPEPFGDNGGPQGGFDGPGAPGRILEGST